MIIICPYCSGENEYKIKDGEHIYMCDLLTAKDRGCGKTFKIKKDSDEIQISPIEKTN